MRADTRRSLREALCAEETEAGSGGAASELDGVCTAAFAGTQRTIHFTGDVGKHLSAKAHLLYIEVPEGSETSLLPPGFGEKLAAKGVPTILYGPNVKYTLARLFQKAAALQEWRYTCIWLYTPREDLLFTSKKPEQLTTRTLCALPYPGDTRKYCTAPAIRRYKFGVEVIVVPLAPGIVGWRTCGTKCTRAAGNCGDVQRPPQTDTSVWDDSSTDCLLAWLVVAALGTGCMGSGDRLSQAKSGAGCTAMCTGTSSRLASQRRVVVGRNAGKSAATACA